MLCYVMLLSLADPGGGAHPAPPPPNGRGPMIFYAQNAIFSQFFLARSPPKRYQNTLKMIFTAILQLSTLSKISYPPPVDKVHAPLRSNPGSA